ncbi:hypothetical protein F4780DRAFT_751983 [Xylariomycetidae sp. FL0641]|nr:hypothetical protein F4780DRAFT_751983 [Xylariomycetidae sp. FL0641]
MPGEEESSPLLPAAGKGKGNALESDEPAESTPLLYSSDNASYDDQPDRPRDPDAASVGSQQSHASTRSSNKKANKPKRWPSFIAMGILGALVVAIIILAFVVPEAVQEYAQQAAVLEPTNLSLDSITADGVRARIQADFRLDGSRVANGHVRRVGKAATWVAHQIGTEQTQIDVHLPDYDNLLLGSAVVPPLVVNLRNGITTRFDFVTDIQPGNVEGVRTIANDWLEGRLERLRLDGKADLSLKSGIFPLGTHTVSESLLFEANKIPAMPQYNITRFNVEDGPFRGSMLADVSLSAFNQYPVALDIPELAFEILVSGCQAADPFILVAEAATGEVHVEPRTDVAANVYAVIHALPDSLTHACPHSGSSPLDLLLRQYMHGEPATLYVRGSSHPDGDTPKWIADILSSVTLPVPFPGRTLDGLIRNFSLTDVHFTLPDPMADPNDPAASPKVSGNILVTAGLPSEMNFGINVTNVRAAANVLYGSRKMGELDLRKWQQANSTKIEGGIHQEPTLQIQSRILEVPLNITDSVVFSEVVQALLFGSKPVQLDVDALVDVKVVTSLGKLILKEVPAEGKIPVKPLPKDTFSSLDPKIGSLRVLDTSADSITLQALVSVANPTPYTAHVPFVNIHVLSNGTVLGDATVENVDITKGLNSDVVVTAKWSPSRSGTHGRHVGRELISQYLSGWNTTVTIKAHRQSIPGQPLLSDALSRFNFTLAAPKLDLPGDGPDEKSHFIRDATFHFLTSTATFTLVSPLYYNTLYLDFVNATALYNHTETVGQILYRLPFSAPPGKSQTPRLPVRWSMGSVGYDAVKKAIGGKLKLDAYANVDIRLGNWKESLWYQGRGIGARVQL